MIIGFAGLWIGRQGTSAAIATSGHIDAYNKISRWIKQFARAHESGPPFRSITVCRQCMEDPNSIVSRFIQYSMRGIGQVVSRQYGARFKFEWLFVCKYFVGQLFLPAMSFHAERLINMMTQQLITALGQKCF